MPPSIVITEPVPRWKAWAQYTLKASSLVLMLALSFYAGVRYERLVPPVAGPSAGPEAAVVREAAAPDRVEPLTPPAPAVQVATSSDVHAPLALDGLQIQTLVVARDTTAAGQLRYAFEVFNEGRLFEGGFELLVLGVQDGQATQWVYPPEGQRGNGVFRMRVAKYLKTEGRFQLPPGLAADAVVLRLREPAGVRASRSTALAEAATAGKTPVSQ